MKKPSKKRLSRRSWQLNKRSKRLKMILQRPYRNRLLKKLKRKMMTKKTKVVTKTKKTMRVQMRRKKKMFLKI